MNLSPDSATLFRIMRAPVLKATLVLAGLLLLAPPDARGDANTISEVALAKGTRWETPAFLRRAVRAGPTVVVVGGMHGDEPAGWRAARAIRHWAIIRGTLVVIPSINRRACEAVQRKVPANPDYDLNRQFPSADLKITGPLARPIWRLVTGLRPDWLLDLHESANYRSMTTAKRKYLGNSLIVFPDPDTERIAGLMAKAANERTPRKDRKWVVIKEPIEGSLARAAAVRLSAHSLIAETSVRDPVAIRVRQHRIAVHRLLVELGMMEPASSPYTLFPKDRKRGEVRLAIYNDGGTGAKSAWFVEQCLPAGGKIRSRRITAAEIAAGALASFDVVAFPGGTGAGQSRTLGEPGRNAVREFVRKGGGYLGFCAGAYLATRHYSWSLGIVDAKVLDTEHWARGTGTVRLRLTAAGRAMFGGKAGPDIYYGQGPILAPAGDPEIPDFDALAIYVTGIAKNGAPKGVMPGTPAIVRGRFGAGRVVLFSAHPERTKALNRYVPQAVFRAVQPRADSTRRSPSDGRNER